MVEITLDCSFGTCFIEESRIKDQKVWCQNFQLFTTQSQGFNEHFQSFLQWLLIKGFPIPFGEPQNV
jgi:hypothetical protein